MGCEDLVISCAATVVAVAALLSKTWCELSVYEWKEGDH